MWAGFVGATLFASHGSNPYMPMPSLEQRSAFDPHVRGVALADVARLRSRDC